MHWGVNFVVYEVMPRRGLLSMQLHRLRLRVCSCTMKKPFKKKLWANVNQSKCWGLTGVLPILVGLLCIQVLQMQQEALWETRALLCPIVHFSCAVWKPSQILLSSCHSAKQMWEISRAWLSRVLRGRKELWESTALANLLNLWTLDKLWNMSWRGTTKIG